MTGTPSLTEITAHFREQGLFCRTLGSPFMAAKPLAASTRVPNPGRSLAGPLWPHPEMRASTNPGFQALSWSGLSILKGTPQPIVDKLEAALKKVMTSPEIKQRLESVGFVVPAPGGAAYTQFVKSELDLWIKVIKTAGIKPE